MYQSFGNVADFKPESFTYTITAQFSSKMNKISSSLIIIDLYPCPNDCSGNGECSQIRKQCICNQGFFDTDCSVSASFLDIKESVSQVVEPNSWKYFYLNAKSKQRNKKIWNNF